MPTMSELSILIFRYVSRIVGKVCVYLSDFMEITAYIIIAPRTHLARSVAKHFTSKPYFVLKY